MRVGSLFAGIGGFDLGFERAGFEVAWCVEWDKAAQAVLRRRFPNAQVYGDIREVDPSQLAPVDVICGGFPCQDLSVAGKRAGLAGERSGLFHDAMRIVRAVRPRVLILENVPGLLSSNRGLDFATVIREVGEGWDCAEVGWRVLDSQFFGVAQRRRRVFVVAGSRAGCAEEVLALAESCGGNPPSRGKAREGVAADAEGRADGGRSWPAEVAPTLNCAYADKMGLEDQHALNGAGHFVPQIVGALTARGPQTLGSPEVDGNHYIPCSATWWDGSDCAATLTKQNANGAQRMPDKGNLGAVLQPFSPHGHYRYEASDQSATLQGRENRQAGSTHLVAQAFRKSKRAQTANDDETWVDDGLANTLNGFDTGDARTTHAVCFDWQKGNDVGNARPSTMNITEEYSQTLGTTRVLAVGVCVTEDAQTTNAVAHAFYSTGGTHGVHTTPELSPPLKIGSSLGIPSPPAVATPMVVRRLTPVECERLQGFPDGWTDIGTDKQTADSHRYKQLGNAVTVNVAEWIARRTKAWLTK